MKFHLLPGAVISAAICFHAAARPLPSSYSLADAGYMIPVKDQGVLGTCWSFSSSTVFETSLVRQGLLPVASASNLTSEWDMATHDGVQLSLVSPYAGWGAFPQQAISYFTRGFGRWRVNKLPQPAGGGPVLRTGDPLNAYPLDAANQGLNLTPYLPPPNQPLLPFRLTQALEFVDTESGRGKPPGREFRDTIKQAILRYGALDTNMNAANLLGPTNTMSKKFDTYAYTGKSAAVDHDVTIIGWNDDVPVYDEAGTLLGVGAWLIQNSWGTSEFKSKDAVPKPDGCFWLGYCDTVAVKYSCALIPERRGGISDTVLQNQIFYYDGTSAGFAKGTPTHAAEKFTAQNDTRLVAIGLWTVADRNTLDIDIYSDWDSEGPAGRHLAVLRDILVPTRGYSEIPLFAPLKLLAGESVYVVVRFGSRIDFPVALDHRTLAVKGQNHAKLSWISSDGRNWQDLYSNGRTKGVFIMKGIQGSKRVRQGKPTLTVTGLRNPIVTSKSSVRLRGIASFNTERVLWRLGKGKVRRAKGTAAAWKIPVRGLRSGRSVVSIWPAAATGVSRSPLKVTIVRK